jgi:hypothetical protein
MKSASGKTAELRPWMREPTHRRIEDLRKARVLPDQPSFIPTPRLRGAKAQGKTFERKVGRKLISDFGLSRLRSNVWFEFYDKNGDGWAGADHILFLPDRIVIFECKLSQTPSGISQIQFLYRPLVQFIFPDRLVQGVQVCKNLYQEAPGQVDSLAEVLSSSSEAIFTWQWLGRG